jgi:hypothetical protein
LYEILEEEATGDDELDDELDDAVDETDEVDPVEETDVDLLFDRLLLTDCCVKQ